MARTLTSEEERNERIIMIGEHIKETGDSTRKTARYFTKTYFPISNATVSDYSHRYMKISHEEVELLREKIDNNTVKDVKNEEVLKRVLLNAKLFLSGLTVLEVAEKTNTSFWTVYRDLTRRLKLVDLELYEEVKYKLTDSRCENLSHAK
ncbi:MAG: sporulation transcriptional regulator SpoIIID [Bacilli bacterium]|nr:sporulation transcriptional regulator SpoIIID [Bacilli bacterium]